MRAPHRKMVPKKNSKRKAAIKGEKVSKKNFEICCGNWKFEFLFDKRILSHQK